MRNKTKHAFTLAETLITLMILATVSMVAVGVVAKKNPVTQDAKNMTGFYECRYNGSNLQERIRMQRRASAEIDVKDDGKDWKNVSGGKCTFKPKDNLQFIPSQATEFMIISVTGGEGTGQKLIDKTTLDGKLCAIEGSAGETKVIYYPPLSEAEMKDMTFEATIEQGWPISQSTGGTLGKNGKPTTLTIKNTSLNSTFTIVAAGGIGGNGYRQREGDPNPDCYNSSDRLFHGNRTLGGSGSVKISW